MTIVIRANNLFQNGPLCHGMRIAALVVAASFCIFWQLADANDRPINFTNNPSEIALTLAMNALRFVYPGEDIPVSDISAALIDLNDNGNPELFIKFRGPDWCGPGGCAMYLLEKPTHGWLVINEWVANDVAVSDQRTGLWHDLILNGRARLRYSGRQYRISD
jgi:hypothetical protein